MKFTSEVSGTVTGIRFYKATTNTGTHIGSLWSSSGTLLASATFTSETRLRLAAGQLLHTGRDQRQHHLCGRPTWRPKATTPTPPPAFASGVTNPPLTALANATSANGVYAYSTTSTFPTSTYKATNYWVDVDFEPAARLPGPGHQRHRHRRATARRA